MGEASILSAAGQVAEYRADAGFVGLQPSMFLFLSEPHRQQSRLHQQIPSQEPHRHQVPSRSQVQEEVRNFEKLKWILKKGEFKEAQMAQTMSCVELLS
ncbi:hypothetical protein SETIT_5G251800v2 [Setaria italica]|uniref:Uncharacterized protein n=1 Tax=Setaria italica TaxID=4555 RepID=A0A368R8I6_SETIT|nr:hypothetical protein SETIT_5G251800v2 [Setaria italica]